MLRRCLAPIRLILCALMAANAAAAECAGQDLFHAMTPAQRAELDAAVAGVPHARGIFWRATKGDARIDIVGTYHFPDLRHAATVARMAPLIATAGALLVEAGPEEEAKLTERLRSDPSLMIDARGPTLPERLGRADWQRVAQAMEDRGVPAVVASRLRPWYVAMMLGLSPCMLEQVQAQGDTGGLDHLLIEQAQEDGVPVLALEPWDTLFTLFDDMTSGEEEDMIRAALPAARHADDYATTTLEAYFAGDIWKIWEFGRLDAHASSGLSRAEVDRQTALAQAELMDARNRDWTRPLTDAADRAAAQGRHVVAAFGALHLPGQNGVLRLLEKDGWTVTEMMP
ncbi:MAG TPA: TraB/GumN family protein [Paracoccus sp. (in: a-proteobacteria)]|nr:TraB/GumN family protein [Paracoccus sp. (in: a-proteobacteria)]